MHFKDTRSECGHSIPCGLLTPDNGPIIPPTNFSFLNKPEKTDSEVISLQNHLKCKKKNIGGPVQTPFFARFGEVLKSIVFSLVNC